MTNLKTKGRRLISALLCLALLMSFLPSFATAIDVASVDDRSVDVNTWDEWKLLFGSDHPSTENAGAVWTDKSVFTPDALPSEYTNAGGTLTDTNDNFLVALSAIASNKEIVGYSTIPTDTILVLDVSGSMVTDTTPSKHTAMVRAANKAIDDLLKLNNHNRVGVVLYNGTNVNDGYSTPSEGSVVLLPLDRYTTTSTYTYREDNKNVSIAGYISLSGNNNISVYSGVKNSDGDNDFNVQKTVSGATYIQSGLYRALEMFKGVAKEDTSIEDGVIQGGTKRMPITVLMSDGAPTVATSNYANVHSDNSNIGYGNDNSATAEVGFLTQLTAAYVKSEIEAWYETDSLFYSLGVGVGNDSVAKAVLDPANATDGSSAYWKTYFGLGDSSSMSLTVPRSGSSGSRFQTKDISIYRNAVITEENYLYTDKYFSANDAAGLVVGFDDIIKEIYIQSRYYPTSLEGGNPDFNGYIEFEDKIGEYMDVKDIKGILLNGTLYTGAMLMEKISASISNDTLVLTESTPDEVVEFVNSVKTRMNIDDATALQLINNALKADQLYYDAQSGKFANHIGWYAYADYSFAGFYNEGTTDPTDYGVDTNNDGIADKFPVYAIQSYGMLGEATGSIKDSDMMYMTIRIVKNLETGDETLGWNIPAALVPMVTYNVAVEGNVINEDTEVTSVTITEATPVRLLYEVGLDPIVNELNVAQITDEKHIDDNGNRVFWTNYFDISAASHDDHVVTRADFTPNEDNERYYYVDIAPIYAAEGDDNAITTAPEAGKTYYTKQYIFSKNSDKPIVYYEAIAESDISEAVYNGTLNCYVIPGHVYNHPNVTDFFKEKADKTLTESAHMYYYPAILKTNASYVVSTHHGNNGRLTVTPAQGIAISKTIDMVEVGASNQFKFKITLSAPAGVSLQSEYNSILSNIGETVGTEGKVQVENGVIEVDLKPDETIYIIGIPEGTAYTVEEISDNDYYMVKNVHVNAVAAVGTIASGTVAKYVIDDVDFLNTPTSEGELVITKNVTHPFTTAPDALADKQFTVEVTLTNGKVSNQTYEIVRAGSTSSVTTDANGKFTVTLKNGESVAIKGIPAETKYTVSEPTDKMPAGFTLDTASSTNLTGTIPADSNILATVVNDYEYTSVATDIDVVVNKDLTGRGWQDGDRFTFEVYKVNGGSANNTLLKSFDLTKNSTSYTYSLADTLTAEGTYYYVVREIAGDDSIGITYDTVDRMFRVTVTDADMDGKLEISAVENISKTVVSGNAQNGFTVTADDFVNVYAPVGSTEIDITIDKDMAGGEFQLNGFKFGLYVDAIDENGQPTGDQLLFAESSLTDANGKASFKVDYTAASVGKTQKYYLKEINTNISGMTYDDTVYIVAVQINDNLDGTISATTTYEKVVSATQTTPVNNITFENTYTPENGELLLSGLKVLENRVQYAGEFAFELHETDSTYTTSASTLKETVSNNFDGSFSFSLLTYSAEGTHYYVVKEVDTKVAGVTYDTTVYKLEVTVEQDGAAYVSKVVSGSTDIVFTNKYTAKSVDVTLSGNKVLTGRDINENEFFFELYETDNSFSTVNKTAAQTKGNVTNTFTFDALTFDKAGTYYYVIKEADGGLGGVAYDDGEYHITVVVTDNGRGQLVATATMTRNGQAATAMVFRNHYTPRHTYVDIEGKKTLNGRNVNEGEFEFRLINALNGDLIATTTNNADGTFVFNDVHITSAGSHHGKIVEVVTDLSGVTYDSRVYGVVIDIEDDLNGNLVEVDRRIWLENALVTEPIEFVNTYKAANELVSLGGTKTLDGRALNDDEFKFNLYKTDSTYDLTNATFVEQVKNADGGKFSFSDIVIDSDEERYYVIVEDATDKLGGVKYDEKVYKVKIGVTDNLEGKYIINTTVTLETATVGLDDIVFNNTYKAADTTVTFNGTKTLDGRDLNEGEFKFNLYKTDSTYDLTNATFVETVNNGTDGAFSFKPYDVKSDEDLYFVIVEDATDKLDGVKYDEKVYKIKVEVTDLLNGEYDVKTVMAVGTETVVDVIFVNVFTPKDIEVEFDVQKILENKTDREMGLDGFDFVLEGEGKKLNAKTDKDGKAGFNLVFTANDIGETFTYKVVETEGNVKGMIYSDVEYTVTVTVAVDSDGVLSANYTVNDTAKDDVVLEFTNVYEGDPDIPVTGETTNITLWFLLLIAGAVGLAATYLLGKNNREAEE